MAPKLDVAARLAEGRQPVDNTQSYVWACHLLNYQNPDLTSHPRKIHDWFDTEEGMDLRVLDADCSAWRSTAEAADESFRRERDQLARISSAWQGSGASSAEDFVRRHCDAAEKVATAVRVVAEALASLRDTLWHIVDTKVAAVMSIDDRRQVERPTWLAASQTITTGVGDRAVASELVDREVKPFVDNDIRGDWLTAVRTANTSIDGSYDAAATGLTAVPPTQFDIPGDFGPDLPPSREDAVPARDPVSTYPGPSAPSPSGVPSYSSPAAMPSYSAPAAMPAGAAVPTGPATATPGPFPSVPAASMGQADGLPQRVADALGAFLPSSDEGAVDDSPLADPKSAESVDGNPPGEGEQQEGDEEDGETDCSSGEDAESSETAPKTGVDDAAPVEPPAVTPEPQPPGLSAEPPAPPLNEPDDQAATPCEIAADELPQAGQ